VSGILNILLSCNLPEWLGISLPKIVKSPFAWVDVTNVMSMVNIFT